MLDTAETAKFELFARPEELVDGGTLNPKAVAFRALVGRMIVDDLLVQGGVVSRAVHRENHTVGGNGDSYNLSGPLELLGEDLMIFGWWGQSAMPTPFVT